MRTDAIMINLPGADQMHKRMDRSKESPDSSSPGFAMHITDKKNMSFNEVYSSVARSNHLAKQITDSSVPTFKESGISAQIQSLSVPLNDVDLEEINNQKTAITQIPQDNKEPECEEEIIGQLFQMQLTGDFSENSQVLKTGTDQTEQATRVIISAVKKIAETLQINIVADLDSISLDTVSQENVKQFAEIVSVVKSITEVLDLTVSQGLPLDTGRAVLDVKSASGAADILRTELFKIELAFNMLGIGDLVQAESAQQMEIPVMTGITQARDPGDISMPIEQITRIFGDLIEDSTEARQKIASMEVLRAVNEPLKEMSVGSFDASTYRTILKLEKKEKVEMENVQSAQNLENLELPLISDPAVATNVSDLQLDTEESMPVLQTDAINQISPKSTSSENKLSSVLQRTTDDHVMGQITTKIQHLVRSGDTEIRIQLRPESLGEVKLAIRMDGDIVAARIQVENQQVKQIVESNLQLLKDALAEQNLQAGSFEVNVGNGWGRQSDQSSHGHKSIAVDSGEVLKGSLEEGDSGQGMINGVETGHRYGNNSIEYYA